MKKQILSIVLIVILFLLAGNAWAASDNFIVNGNFEQPGFTGWHANGFAQWAWYDVPGVQQADKQGLLAAHAGFTRSKRTADLRSDWVQLQAGSYQVQFCLIAPAGYAAQNLFQAQLQVENDRFTLYDQIVPATGQPVCLVHTFSIGIRQKVRLVFHNTWQGNLNSAAVYTSIQGVDLDSVSLRKK